MTYTGYEDDELMGLPGESSKIQVDVKYKFTRPDNDMSRKFVASEPKKKKDVNIIDNSIIKRKPKQKPGKGSSNLF